VLKVPAKPLSDEQLISAAKLVEKFGSLEAGARAANMPSATMRHHIMVYKQRFGNNKPKDIEPDEKSEFTVVALPEGDLDIEELVELRIKQFGKRKEYEEASKLIDVKVNLPGPIGIIHFGDPHVDDDGTDLATLREHSDLTKQEGVWGANVGDTTNNWVGRLARLYASQSTSAEQAWKLAEWFISRTRWLYMIGGNHDAWSGSADPIKWIARQTDTLYKPSECRVNLKFPGGRNVIVNARHDFAGSSQWNPAHAQMKAAQMGYRDHVMISGHKHTSGYGIIKDPNGGKICHAIQVASYKLYDTYAKEKGFRDQTVSPACMTIIDPSLQESHPDMVKIFWCPKEGSEFLKWKRKKK
jgi:hypothetical protein